MKIQILQEEIACCSLTVPRRLCNIVSERVIHNNSVSRFEVELVVTSYTDVTKCGPHIAMGNSCLCQLMRQKHRPDAATIKRNEGNDR
jgi:hypothetical protein